MTQPSNEMQADLARARIEADAQIKIEQIKANAAIEKESYATKRANAFDRDSLLVTISILGVLLLTLGFGVGQHMYHTYQYNRQVEQCQQAGGMWDVKTIEITPDTGDPAKRKAEAVEYCNMTYNNP